jgi:hypothetical protein
LKAAGVFDLLRGNNTMKQTTTTRATHRGVEIAVLSDRIGHQTMFSCTNGRSTGRDEEQWFSTQGEAIANERQRIDRILG